MRTPDCMMEELVNRLESEMGLLDFQAEKAVCQAATDPPSAPGAPVSLRQALEYSGVVYVRGGMPRRQYRVQPKQAFSNQAFLTDRAHPVFGTTKQVRFQQLHNQGLC